DFHVTGVQTCALPIYAHEYELTYDQLKEGLGAISLKNYAHGRLNPKAFLYRDLDMEGYLNAPMIAWPLGLHDCCSMPSGAAAARSEERRVGKECECGG